MLQETAMRALRLKGALPPIIVCSEEHRFLVAQQLREIEIAPKAIILEPFARSTAPALAAASLNVIFNQSSMVLALPADHLISDEVAFGIAVASAKGAASKGSLVTFGITPQHAETGYGYIERGKRLDQDAAFKVLRFIEKPSLDLAKNLVSTGNFLWNSGMFMMHATRYLEELERNRPDIFNAVQAAWRDRTIDSDFVRLDANSFETCPTDSIDTAVMEKTNRAAVVQVDMGWSDIGSWASLWKNSPKDSHGNVLRGDVDAHGTQNSYLRAEERLLSVNGLNNVVVIETRDAVLVTTLMESQNVKDIVSRLSDSGRLEHVNHRLVYRPWGYYESIDNSAGFQVKRLMVKPGEALSLQLHHRRAEHWVVVSGTARVTRGDEVVTLSRNESTYIPVGMKHRLENVSAEPLYLIEVQSGDYLGEDDIVRFEDRYSRS